jgi:hypothetical protein
MRLSELIAKAIHNACYRPGRGLDMPDRGLLGEGEKARAAKMRPVLLKNEATRS